MRVNKKGIFVVIFFGGILLTSTVLFALPPPAPTMSEAEYEAEMTKTGTPMDNFPDDQRATFCGVEDAKSNSYITEYKIPTVCSQPLAIKVTPDGNVWFVETNAGRIAKFNPVSEKFTEFENELWPEQARSMSWGMDYSPDGSLWYTDGRFNTIWKFSTINETYEPISYPVGSADSELNIDDALPQKLEIDGSNIFVNDFTGGKITVFGLTQNIAEQKYVSILNPIPDGFTGDFAVDSEDYLWYTNWIPEKTGFLVKFDLEKYQMDASSDVDETTTLENYIDVFDFPIGLNTANGLTIDFDDNVWIVDTSSSFFFKFNPETEEFTKYVTTVPDITTFGNATGLIKSPISRPYWIQTDNNGNIVFNEQTSNQIAIFDKHNESLIEYMIPSKNPNWADCGFSSKSNCGISQVFGFDVIEGKIWFTEWAENNIGVVDTRKPLPFSLEFDKESLSLKKGQSEKITMSVTYKDISDSVKIKSSHTASSTTNFSDIIITSSDIIQGNTEDVIFTILANDLALSGDYKVLLGIANDDVTITQYIDVSIES